MKRTTKRYVITTSVLNCYLYRVLTSGVDYGQYLNNPILLWMHIRAKGNTKDQILPLGRVVDIRMEGDALTCYLEFDEKDTFAMSVYNKYEAGILNMLSLGAVPLLLSDEPAMMLPGQVGPTVVKCKMTDVSCVDIGGNDDALPVQLYDEAGKVIALSRGNINALITLVKVGKQDVLSNVEHTPKTLAIVKNGVAAGKLTADTANKLLSLGNDGTAVDLILNTVKTAKIDPDKLDGVIHRSLMPLLPKNIDDIGSGDLGLLKQHAPEVYKAKFFEKNDRLPAERDGKPL